MKRLKDIYPDRVNIGFLPTPVNISMYYLKLHDGTEYINAVSYTHLDVYKRQIILWIIYTIKILLQFCGAAHLAKKIILLKNLRHFQNVR